MKLFLDDERNAPDTDWVVIRDPHLFYRVLLALWNDVTEISLDHDLGDHVPSGYSVLASIEARVLGKKNVPHNFFISIHSMNPVGHRTMKVVADKLNSKLGS